MIPVSQGGLEGLPTAFGGLGELPAVLRRSTPLASEGSQPLKDRESLYISLFKCHAVLHSTSARSLKLPLYGAHFLLSGVLPLSSSAPPPPSWKLQAKVSVPAIPFQVLSLAASSSCHVVF